ncbi:ABC transporter ATP-binding protein [Thalassorhabdomicrobium marinisediminis]|uniref:ABC transporter ATP-binding protein n=1 Tax=Thalassorhabdomicrobium marinisediminis TaxID=2170577 RepID=UPI00249147FE|nr:ABC transporter ATP-binding protein [Thalassorhabdomicrobium marinisediminis]
MAVLTINGLSVALPSGGDRALAVEGVSLSVAKGETLCLVGESGSGKSVIAQAVMGMLPPQLPITAGSIAFDGAPLPAQRSDAFLRLRSVRMAMIFQDASASLDPLRRVGDQLEEIAEVHGIGRAARKRKVAEILQAVRLPDPAKLARAYPHQLSGGQAQRVVIAAALLLDPELLIADEPTTALDVTTQAEILALIDDLRRERGTAVLFITHDFGVVSDIADRVVVLRQGEIVETGAAKTLLADPQHPYTRTLLAAATARGAPRDTERSDVVMAAQNIHLTYGLGGLFNRREVEAVKDVSLTLHRGRTTAVVGESGSGKSSFARCLLRLEEVTSGTITFEGRDITHLQGAEMQALRKRIQVVLQDPFGALNPRRTIGSAIAEGPIIHGASKAEARAKAEELLDLVGLTPQAFDRHPHEFSGGQRQRICIARALALDPDVLIADESVSALDVSIQAQILDLFRELQARLGFTMLFITHDLRVAAAIADHLLVMQNGRAVEQGDAAEIFANPQQPYTRALLAAAPGKDLPEVSAA